MEQATLLDAYDIETRWHSQFETYSKDLLKIQTMEGDLLPFQMNDVQVLLHQVINEIKSEGRPVRLVILKARREGISTYTTGRFYWKTSTNFNRYGMIITHEPDATDFLFSMVKRYHTHNEWKPEIRYSNKKILEFNTKDGKGLDSAVRVATAGKEDVGAGQLIHYLHLSEVAKWPTHTTEALLTGVLQCVPNDPDTEVIFESTAKGMGGEFYDRYGDCRFDYEFFLEDGKPTYKCNINEDADENSIYSSIFIPWFVFSKYVMEVPEDFEMTREEEEFVTLYGLTAEHLQWRRWAIPNLCGGDPKKFMQEYPSNAVEAFLSSGHAVFDGVTCKKLKKFAPRPKTRYECQISNGNWISESKGRLKVWSEPQTGRHYVIGADVAEGLEKGDFSSIDVVDHITSEHVAQWHGKVDPDVLGHILYHLGLRYNKAWIAPERNNHGLTTITTLINLGYEKIWVEKVAEPPNKIIKRFGWLTSRKTKPQMVDLLVSMMREGIGDACKCAETFGEMLTFKQEEKGTGLVVFGAEEGKLDDRIISLGVAHIVRTMLPLPRSDYKPQYKDPRTGESVDTPSPLAWT